MKFLFKKNKCYVIGDVASLGITAREGMDHLGLDYEYTSWEQFEKSFSTDKIVLLVNPEMNEPAVVKYLALHKAQASSLQLRLIVLSDAAGWQAQQIPHYCYVLPLHTKIQELKRLYFQLSSYFMPRFKITSLSFMKGLPLVTAVIACFLMSSCVSPKKLYYFNDQEQHSEGIDSLANASRQQIQKGDRLSIIVSCPDPSQTAFLNPNATGYLVLPSGDINFPMLGDLHVEGMNSDAAAIMIRQRLSRFFKDLYVAVNQTGKVMVMHGKGGQSVSMNNERLTIFEAIAQGGGNDLFDQKDKVWVIREEDGKRTYAQVNLLSKDIFQSPYYYLHNNDLIYTKPGLLPALVSSSNPVRGILAVVTGLLTLYFILLKRL